MGQYPCSSAAAVIRLTCDSTVMAAVVPVRSHSLDLLEQTTFDHHPAALRRATILYSRSTFLPDVHCGVV